MRTWQRLEPRTRDQTMEAGIRAAVYDPLWMLARQWQWGEFAGEDGGSPISARLLMESNPITRILGAPEAGPEGHPYDPGSAPLEAAAEKETARAPAGGPGGGEGATRRSVEAGLHLIRLLRLRGVGGADAHTGLLTPLLERYPVPSPSHRNGARAGASPYLSVMAGRAPNGYRIRHALAEAERQGSAAAIKRFLDEINVEEADHPAAWEVFHAWKTWYDALPPDPGGRFPVASAWDPQRMEYSFSVAAPSGVQEPPPLRSWGMLDRVDHGSPVLALAFGPGGRLASGGEDGAVRVWEGGRPAEAFGLVGHEGRVLALAFGPEGRLASGGEDGAVRVWEGDEPAGALDHGSPVLALAFSPEGRLASGGEDGAVRVWEEGNSEPAEPPREETVLSARAYRGGRLDWHAFERAAGPPLRLGAGTDPRRPQLGRTLLPTAIRFPGMPLDRWWAFEDASVDLGALDAGPEDLARLVFVEFAVSYGSDWFVLPVELEAGTVTRLFDDSLRVMNVFGEVTDVRPVSAVTPGSPWRMYELSGAGARVPPFFLAPALPPHLEGERIEEVRLIRDEMANVAWAIERVAPSPVTGSPVSRYEQYQEERRLREAAAPERPPAQAPIAYRLGTEVPGYWVPLVPRHRGGDRRSVQLERGTLLNAEEGHLGEAMGALLEETSLLYEEEVPRAGARVTRAYQLARWSDGSTHLWIGRRKVVGRGEGASGLRFDVVEPAETPAE